MDTVTVRQRDASTFDFESRRGLVRAETVNCLTHAGGCVLSLFAAALLMSTAWETGDAWRILGCAVYAAALIAVYAASTLSHAFDDPARRRFYRMLDQVSIFLLVAGTYTPFGMVHAREQGWWLVLAVMWTCSLAGIVVRFRRPDQTLRPLWFIVIAWMPICTIGHAYHVSQLPGLSLVLAGGLAYTGGVWFLVNDDRYPYFHAVWHLSTIAGSALHYFFLLHYVAAPLA